MAPVRWAFQSFVPVRPDDVWRWMTDFRADDHGRPAYKRGAGVKPGKKEAVRTVLAREGNVVRLRDEWGGRRFEVAVTLHEAKRELTLDGGHGYRARWWVEPSPGGARFHVEGELAPTGLFGLLAPLFAKGMVRESERDFRGHVADMVSELNPEGQPVET